MRVCICVYTHVSYTHVYTYTYVYAHVSYIHVYHAYVYVYACMYMHTYRFRQTTLDFNNGPAARDDGLKRPQKASKHHAAHFPGAGVQDDLDEIDICQWEENDVVDENLLALFDDVDLDETSHGDMVPDMSGGIIGRAHRAGLTLHAQTRRTMHGHRQSNTAQQGESALYYARDIALSEPAAAAFFDHELARIASLPGSPTIEESDEARKMLNAWAAPYYDREIESSVSRRPGVFRMDTLDAEFYEDLFVLDPTYAIHYATTVCFGSNPTISSVPPLVCLTTTTQQMSSGIIQILFFLYIYIYIHTHNL